MARFLRYTYTDDEAFEIYIAWRRFRTEMWRHHPFLRFARWAVPHLSRALGGAK